MNDMIDESRRLKTRAMDLRDSGNYQAAVDLLTQEEDNLRAALKELKSNRDDMTPPGSFEKDVANQLVHLLGSKGGVLRRDLKYPASAEAYDAGYEYERPESGYEIVNSYTQTQRLVTRVFIEPRSVCDQDVVVLGLPVQQELLKAEDEIQRQLSGPRENDPYAAADLAMVRLLLGDEKWEQTLDAFLDMKPDSYAIKVTREVMDELCNALDKFPSAPVELSDRLKQACDYL